MNAPGSWLLIFLPLFYVVMWYGVLRLIAFLTGWTRLAEQYPGVSTPTGERVRASTLGVGWGSYNNCVRFVADEEGLHISLWRIFSIGHAPLFIPWSEMHFESTRKVWGWGKTVKVSVGTPSCNYPSASSRPASECSRTTLARIPARSRSRGSRAARGSCVSCGPGLR